MTKRVFTLVLSFVMIFSSGFLCNAVEEIEENDFRTDTLLIVIKNENITDRDWLHTRNALGIDSIESIYQVFEDANGDVLYAIRAKIPDNDGIRRLKAELETDDRIDYVGLIGYVSDDPSVFDVTLDGELSAADARFALRCSVGLEECTAVQLMKGDTDGDEKFTASDARTILRCAVGLSVEINMKYDFSLDSLILSVKEECMPDTTELSLDFFGSDLIKDVEYLLGNRSYAVYLKEPGEENLFKLKEYLENCEKVEYVNYNGYGYIG